MTARYRVGLCRHLLSLESTPYIEVAGTRYCLDCAADRYAEGQMIFGGAAFVLGKRRDLEESYRRWKAGR